MAGGRPQIHSGRCLHKAISFGSCFNPEWVIQERALMQKPLCFFHQQILKVTSYLFYPSLFLKHELIAPAHTQGDYIEYEKYRSLGPCQALSTAKNTIQGTLFLYLLCRVTYNVQRTQVHFHIWILQQLFEVIRVVLGAELFNIQAKWNEVRLSNLFNRNQ